MRNKIIYVHGLSSSGASLTAETLRKLLPDVEVLSPDLPIQPQEALIMLQNLCKDERPDIIIGTSMGGMFAQQLYGFKKILVNPAFHVSEFMRKNIGVQPFLNVRKNGETHYEITPELCDAYQELENVQFKGITDYDRMNTYALFGENDTLVNCYEEYSCNYTKAAWFKGEHRLQFEDVRDVVVKLIEQILN